MSDELIKIVDQKEMVPLEQVRGKVVKIGNRYYYKTSEKVVNVMGRYYRKASPLIQECEHPYNHHCLKEYAIQLYDGSWANKTEVSIVSVQDPKDQYALERDTIKSVLNSKRYLKSKVDFVFCNVLKRDVLKQDTITLAEWYYGSNFYVTNHKISKIVTCDQTQQQFLRDDCVVLHNPVGKNSYYVNKQDAIKMNIQPVLNGACSVANAGEATLEYNLVDVLKYQNDITYVDELMAYVASNRLDTLKKYLDRYKRYEQDSKYIKTNIKQRGGSFSALDFSFDEPFPSTLNLTPGDISGANIYFKPSSFFRRPHFSPSRQLTGGIGYTFGVEKETCVGIVPDHICEYHGFMKIGDGSTRYDNGRDRYVHYEYVSSVLHGDMGIQKLKSFFSQAAQYTAFNEKCSTHIHVGGQMEGSNATDIPRFNREFSAYAIKLGTQVEESLNRLFTKERDVNLNHQCGSVLYYKDFPIETREQRNKLIAQYVFNTSKLGKKANSKSDVSKWSDAKRKWLNLINANATATHRREKSIKTVEFRIFPPTNNEDKIHFYTLIALAFVWFVENRRDAIVKGGLEIFDVLEQAYSTKPIWGFVEEQIKNHLKNNKRK